MLKLNVGAGGNIKSREDGWVNLDAVYRKGIDVVHDLHVGTIPYPDGCIDHIEASDVIEHLHQWLHPAVFSDFHRLLKDGGTFYICVPDLRVIAQRYLKVLQKPTELQHEMDADQVSNALFGGRDNDYSYHRWAYDEHTLAKALTDAGFAIISIGSDGGSNLICTAKKALSDVFVWLGGGLGDSLSVYLWSEDSDRLPSPDQTDSKWFRRLRSFKAEYPDVKIALITKSHNPFVSELFLHHPYIDEVIDLKWEHPKNEKFDKNHDAYLGMTYIDRGLDVDCFEPDDTMIYLSESDKVFIAELNLPERYALIHPFAGNPEREPLSAHTWCVVANRIADVMPVVVVGASYDTFELNTHAHLESFPDMDSKRFRIINLVDKANIRVSTVLTQNAHRFIGLDSAMILVAWGSEVKSLCIIPEFHDTGEHYDEIMKNDRPNSWGLTQARFKTVMVRSPEDLILDDVMEWLE